MAIVSFHFSGRLADTLVGAGVIEAGDFFSGSTRIRSEGEADGLNTDFGDLFPAVLCGRRAARAARAFQSDDSRVNGSAGSFDSGVWRIPVQPARRRSVSRPERRPAGHEAPCQDRSVQVPDRELHDLRREERALRFRSGNVAAAGRQGVPARQGFLHHRRERDSQRLGKAKPNASPSSHTAGTPEPAGA